MESPDKPYEMIEHTADIGFRVRGESLQKLFENAAFSLFDNVAELKNVQEDRREEVQLNGIDLPELMVTWLNHLLYLWETKLVLFKRFSVQDVNETALKALVWGQAYRPEQHDLLTDIKAATYHRLRIEQEGNHWIAEIILDT